MKDHYFRKKDFIYYRKNKFNSKRETIVFVHGLSGSSSGWRPYEALLDKEFNILSFDLRGHGKSFRPDKLEDYKIEKFSEDLYALAKKEKLSNFILVSHSFGNLVTLDFLRNHQNLVKASIFVSPDPSPGKRLLAKILIPPLILITHLSYLFPKIKQTGTHIDYTNFVGTGDWNVRRTIVDVMNIGLRSDISCIKYSYEADYDKVLHMIKIPSLIVHGDKDTIFPIERGKRMHNEIKGSKFVTFKGADHIIVLNNVEELTREIRKFVKSLN